MLNTTYITNLENPQKFQFAYTDDDINEENVKELVVNLKKGGMNLKVVNMICDDIKNGSFDNHWMITRADLEKLPLKEWNLNINT